jgi:glycosyltransferase involved in cell wall biosynthesis
MVSSHRLLVDYPEDLKLLELVLQKNGNDCTLEKAISFLDKNRWATKLNEHPIVTVYTCAFNAEKFIDRCIGSVAMQSIFGQAEYILVDDHSSDDTVLKMARASTRFPNIRFIRNQYNKGLASSSNVALSDARGKYIIRLDADDYFLENNALETMVSEISTTKRDAIYPDNYFGSLKKIQSGKENHHVGGAIFSRSAMNHLKFTEQLRGYEGLDFFGRARDQLSIGYLKKPMFFYRQRKDSMSKSNVIERAEIKRQLQEKYGPLHS